MPDKIKRNQQPKNTSGITLMVLIITVVIMLILASVSVSLFTSGDGIFNNSDTAVIEYKRKSLIEVVKAADIYLEQNNRFDRTKKKDIVELVDKIKEISEVNDKDYIIDVRPEEQSATIIDKKTGVAVDILIDEKDRVIIETSVIENIKDITVPKVEHTINPQEPEKATVVTITIKATEENKGIAKIKFPDGTEKTYSNEKTVTEPYKVTKNDSYRFIVVGANGRQAIETVKITNIKGVTDINMEILNPEPTNDKTRIKITYDENPAFEGKELTNADRYQFSKGENNWETATTNPMIVETETNGIIYARYYDGKEGHKIKPVTVNNIDKLPPYDFDLQVTATENSITVSAVGRVEDRLTDGCAPSNGGIRGYQFQLLNADGTTVLKDWIPAYPSQENSSYTFNQTQDGVEIQLGTTYKVNMRAIDKAGNKTEARNRDNDTAKVTIQKEPQPIAKVVKVGDYVDYDAGKWTQEDFEKIRKSEGTPEVQGDHNTSYGTEHYKGFTLGERKNDNAYGIKAGYNQKPSYAGWRVWNIDDKSGEVKLITAGTPEQVVPYLSETLEDSGVLYNYAGPLKLRDCTMYENDFAKKNSAHILTAEETVSWYNTHFGTSYTVVDGNANESTFLKKPITNRLLEDLIDIGASYWVATNSGEYGLLAYYSPSSYFCNVTSRCLGLRIVLTLKGGVMVNTEGKTGSSTRPFELLER